MSVRKLFGVAVEGLDTAHLTDFLADAGEESLLWEAKADGTLDEPPRGRIRPEHIETPACAFANQVGGCVLVGVKRVDDEWRLVGVEAPEDEFELWLDKAVAGLSPPPQIKRKAWTLDDNRVVAVVDVAATSETPCMTRRGGVYVRTSSESVKVTDPTQLAALFERGRAARASAESHAIAAGGQALADGRLDSGSCAWIASGLCAVNYPADISARLFTESFKNMLVKQTNQRLFVDVEQQNTLGVAVAVGQEFVEVYAGGGSYAWLVRVSWTGAAAAVLAVDQQQVEVLNHMHQGVRAARILLGELVDAIGGFGDCHHLVTVRARPHRPGQDPDDPGVMPHDHLFRRLPRGEAHEASVQRWTTTSEPSKAEMQSISRELLRAGGERAFEDAEGGGETYCR